MLAVFDASGAQRVALYGADGTPLLTTGNPGAVQGVAAHDAAGAGNPLRVAGVYHATPPTGADGDVLDILTDAAGRPMIDVRRFGGTDSPVPRTPADAAALVSGLPVEAVLALFNGATLDRMRSWGAMGSDANAGLTTGAAAAIAALLGYNGATFDRLRAGVSNAAATGMLNVMGGLAATWADGVSNAMGQSLGDVRTAPLAFNDTSWDRFRNNTVGTALASAARTATTSSADITNYNAVGIIIYLNITAIGATPTVTVEVQSKDSISGFYLRLAQFTALSPTGADQRIYGFVPGGGTDVAGNVEWKPGRLPRTFRIAVAHGDADSITYSVGYALIV